MKLFLNVTFFIRMLLHPDKNPDNPDNAVSGAANISFHSTHFVIMNIVGMSNYNQLENCPWQNGNTHLAQPPPLLSMLGK